jgi:hypothetical protein
MDDHRLVRQDLLGGDLEPDQGNDQGVAVRLPPAFLARGARELDQLLVQVGTFPSGAVVRVQLYLR